MQVLCVVFKVQHMLKWWKESHSIWVARKVKPFIPIHIFQLQISNMCVFVVMKECHTKCGSLIEHCGTEEEDMNVCQILLG